MNNQIFVRAICRTLMVCVAAVSFQAQAGLITTGEAAGAAQPQGARAAILVQLEKFGLSGEAARARVAALSDAEAAQLAGRISSAPAGADGGIVFGFLAVVIFLFWRFGFSDQAKAEQKVKETPAKKQ